MKNNMELKEYIVTLHKHEDLDDFYQDMETPGGNLYIPDRAVEVVNRRPISRNTHYWLSQEEANQIKQDPRVWDVDIPSHLQPKINITPSWSVTGDFGNVYQDVADRQSWHLSFCTSETPTPYQLFQPKIETVSRNTSGKGVDVINVEALIQPTGVEWAENYDGTGNSRLNLINWYGFGLNGGVGLNNNLYVYSANDYYSDHAHQSSSLAAGSRYSFARKSTIINGTPTGVSYDQNNNPVYSTKLDYVRQYHNWKKINLDGDLLTTKPSVCHTSVNSQFFFSIYELNTEGSGGGPVTINYRGTSYYGPWSLKPGVPENLYEEYKSSNWWNGTVTLQDLGFPDIVIPVAWLGGGGGNDPDKTKNYKVGVATANTAENADITDAINDGVIMVFSAGNSYRRLVDSSHADFNNTLVFNGGTTYYINRSEYASSNPILAGNLGSDLYLIASSARGPGITIIAPGSETISATLDSVSTAPWYVDNDPRNSTNKVSTFGGTSAACPVVASVIACILELNPNMSHGDMTSYIKSIAKSNAINGTEGFNLFGYNKTLFLPEFTFSISASESSISNGESITFTITTTNVPNGSTLYITEGGTSTIFDFADGSIQRAITVDSNSATFTRTLSSLFKGSKTSIIQVRTGGYSGTIQATASTVTLQEPTGQNLPVVQGPTTSLSASFNLTITS